MSWRICIFKTTTVLVSFKHISLSKRLSAVLHGGWCGEVVAEAERGAWRAGPRGFLHTDSTGGKGGGQVGPHPVRSEGLLDRNRKECPEDWGSHGILLLN